MADYYLDSFVGVKDSTLVPPLRQDGRRVGAKLSSIFASKVAAQALLVGDRVFAGTLRAGETLREVLGTVSATLGTTTLSLGTTAAPTKYVNAVTLTATDKPTVLGPQATAADDQPLAADEDLWWTLGVGGIAGGTIFNSELRIASVK